MPAPKDPAAYALYIERLRKSHTGLKRSEEAKRKLGEWSRRTKTGVPRPDMVGDGNPMRRPEVTAKLSEFWQGRIIPPEQRAKIAESLRGQFAGDRNPNWNGDSVGYVAVHGRAKSRLPMECAFADATCKGPLQCALRHDAPSKSLRIDTKGLRYSVAPTEESYMRLCQSHHARYDRVGFKKR